MRVDPLQILTKLAAVQNIPTRRVTPPFEGLEEFDYGLRRSLDPQFDWQEFGQLLLDSFAGEAGHLAHSGKLGAYGVQIFGSGGDGPAAGGGYL